MATVNKDFKIKQGLVVEGATATVNGNQVLTENASDQYILDLIGGETLVKSVSSELSVDGSGQLSIDRNVTDDWYDASGEAATAELNAKNYADGLASNYDPAGSAFDAQQNAEGYTDAQLTNYTTTANLDTTIDGYGYLKSADLTGYATESYVDQAETDAKAYADSLINDASNLSTEVWSAYKTNTEIGLAQSAAESYADTAIANLVDSAPATLDTLNELAAALQDNPDIITDLQDIAAGKQDTLTAGSNISIDGSNVISVTGLDSADISDFNTAALSATSSAYDAAGSATTAENNAKTYTDNQLEAYVPSSSLEATIDGYGFAYTSEIPGSTDSLTEGVNNLYYTDNRVDNEIVNYLTSNNVVATNIDFQLLAGQLHITAENGVAGSTTNDLVEGTDNSANGGTGNNLYFTDQRVLDAISGDNIAPAAVTIDTYRKEEATQQYVANASTVNVYSLQPGWESAKFLVRVVGMDGGVKHSQITEILMTVDGNNNIAITEYGNVHTSTNPLATFSAANNGSPLVPSFTLTATTAVAGCEIIAAATTLSWAD